MNDASSKTGTGGEAFTGLSRDQIHSALFAQMVMQQSKLALMLLGKTPHPDTGKALRDLDAAKLFIDQLEMLEVNTKGNLTAQETALLKQSLMTLHLAFVEAANGPETPPPAQQPTTNAAKDDSPASGNKTAPAKATGAVDEEESRKRFSKKY